MNEELAAISCEIIAKVGAAKGLFVEAIELAAKGEIEKAKQSLKEGEEVFNEGHASHGKLLADFADGKEVNIDLLLVHAECQMMSAEDFKVIAEEVISIKENQ